MKATIQGVNKAQEMYQVHDLNVDGRRHRQLATLTTLKEAPGFKLYRVGGESGIMGFVFIPSEQAKAEQGSVEINLEEASA